MFILGTPSSDTNGTAYPYLQPSQYLPSYTAELALLKQALRAAAAAKRADGHTLTGTFLQHFLPSLIELVNSVQQVGDELLESIAEGLKNECSEALDGDLLALEADLPMTFPDLEARIGAVNASLATCFDGGVLGRVPGAAVVHRRFRLSRRELMLTLQRSAAALADSNGNAVATGCAELRSRYHDTLSGMVDALVLRSDAFFDAAAEMEGNFTAACRLDMLDGVPAKAEARRRLGDAIARFAADLEKHRRIMRYRAFESTAWVLGLAGFGMMLVVYVGIPLHPSIRVLALLCLAPYLIIWLRSNLRALQGWVVPERYDAAMHAIDGAHAALFGLYKRAIELADSARPVLERGLARVLPFVHERALPLASKWGGALAGLLQLLWGKGAGALQEVADVAVRVETAEDLRRMLALVAHWDHEHVAGAALVVAGGMLALVVALRVFCCCCCGCSRRGPETGAAPLKAGSLR
jgi:hypothetical protein